METVEDNNNFLTNRREVKIIVEAEKNPSFEEASDLIVKEFKADKELVVVSGIKGKFGRNTFLIQAVIYKSKEDKENFEGKKEVKPKQAQTQEQPVTEQTPEQKPAEEKVEEVKEEKVQVQEEAKIEDKKAEKVE